MITYKSGKVIHIEESQSDETFVCNSLIPGKEDAALVRRLVERLDHEAEDQQVINLEIDNVNVTITIDYHTGTVSQTRKKGPNICCTTNRHTFNSAINSGNFKSVTILCLKVPKLLRK